MEEVIQIINIDDIEYVTAEELFNKAPIYVKGNRNARELIKKKNIGDNYIFAAKNKKDGKWKVTDGSSKKIDQVLFVYSWVQENIPEMNSDNNGEKNDYLILPKELRLKDEEMFRDGKGNRIHIQVVGEKEHDKCYFRVKDVMNGLGMKNLYKTIIDNRQDTYKENIHYQYFYCKKVKENGKHIVKKELYLAYSGFLRLITYSNISKNGVTLVLHKWLLQFDNRLLKSHVININKHIENSKIGYTYCITSPTMNIVKIGFWSGTPESLKSRYITYYGNNLDIFYVHTADAYKLEQKCHKHFINKKISNELFDKQYIDEYKKYLNDNKEYIPEDNIMVSHRNECIQGKYKYRDENDGNDCNINEIACIYLLTLNSVKNLRESMNIDRKYGDDKFVCKYGFSKDFKQRMETHKQEFKHIKGANLSLKNIALIDPKYISNAEKDIKSIISKYSLQFEKFDELIVLDKQDFVELEKYYTNLSYKYRGHNENLNNMIIELKLTMKDIENNHKIELIQKEKEMIQKERELDREKAKVREEKLRYESLEKDVKILEMEKQLLLAQNNTKKPTNKK